MEIGFSESYIFIFSLFLYSFCKLKPQFFFLDNVANLKPHSYLHCYNDFQIPPFFNICFILNWIPLDSWTTWWRVEFKSPMVVKPQILAFVLLLMKCTFCKLVKEKASCICSIHTPPTILGEGWCIYWIYKIIITCKVASNLTSEWCWLKAKWSSRKKLRNWSL